MSKEIVSTPNAPGKKLYIKYYSYYFLFILIDLFIIIIIINHSLLLFIIILAAIGPYSQAVTCNGMVYCSGQIGMDLEGNLVEGGVSAQTSQLMNNLKEVVEASGSNMNKVVKCTVLLA
jgi:enamine deaminase RidA (YjgF/YER057c/UK114 family)